MLFLCFAYSLLRSDVLTGGDAFMHQENESIVSVGSSRNVFQFEAESDSVSYCSQHEVAPAQEETEWHEK